MTAIKRPLEQLVYTYDFAPAMGAAAIVTPLTAVTSTPRIVGAANLVETARAVVGSEVRIKWGGGAIDNQYLTLVRLTDSNGAVHEVVGEIDVEAAAFTVPIGIASRYLTGEEYVARFGVAETVRLTDEDGLKVVATDKLDQAIKDATDVADGYIAARYTIPLASTPRVVKSIVATLAREALHKTRPTPEVTAAADRARTQLRDIAAGRMALPVEVGGTAPTVGSNRGALRSGAPGLSTLGEALEAYRLDAGVPVANWRQ